MIWLEFPATLSIGGAACARLPAGVRWQRSRQNRERIDCNRAYIWLTVACVVLVSALNCKTPTARSIGGQHVVCTAAGID